MTPLHLSEGACEMVKTGMAIIQARYHERHHEAATTVNMVSDRTYSGVHLGTSTERLAVIAQPIVLCQAMSQSKPEVALAVTFKNSDSGQADQAPRIYPPCHMHQALIADYGPKANLVSEENGQLRKASSQTSCL